MRFDGKPVNPDFDGVDLTGLDEADALRQHWGLVTWRARSWLNRARRLAGTSVELEEVESYAATGLLRAFRAFDPARGCRFSTLAVRYINTEIDKAINASSRWGSKGELNVRRGYRETLPRVSTISAVAHRMSPDGGGEDTIRELSTSDPARPSDTADSSLFDPLPDDERTVMRHRYAGRTRSEVACIVGCTINDVIRAEGRAVLRLAGDDHAALFTTRNA